MTALNANNTLKIQRHHHARNDVQETMLTSKQNKIIVKMNLFSKMIALCEVIRERSLQYNDNEDLRSHTLIYI